MNRFTHVASLTLLALLAAPHAARCQLVSGLVAEQLSLSPAHGAVVVLLKVTDPDGLEQVAVASTDEDGAFSLTVPGPGTFRVQANLDGLASPLSRKMELGPGADDVTDLALLLPSPLLHLALGCQVESEEGAAAAVGVVLDADSYVPLPDAFITATWKEGRMEHRLEAVSDASGRYRICGLPVTAGLVSFRGDLLGRSSPLNEVEVKGRAVIFHDIVIPVATGADKPKDVIQEKILLEAAAEGLGDLHGELRDQLSGSVLPYAVVRILGTPHQTQSDQGGRFVFEGLSPGSYTLEIRNLGYAVTSDPVEIPAGKDVSVTLGVAPQVMELEGLEVTTRSAVEKITRVTPFRRDIAYGEAMAKEELRGAMAYEILQRTSPGIEVTLTYRDAGPPMLCVQTNRRVQSLTSGGCSSAQVVLDGVRIADGSDFLLHTPASVIESIEFVSPFQAQITYGIGGNTANGVVVVYTRGRGPYASPLRNRDGG